MPRLLIAANISPPVEIVVVDYNSQDDLRGYIKTVMNGFFEQGVSLTYRRYTGRDYYHMAHARNLTIRAASGDYIVISSTDIAFKDNYFDVIRQTIDETKAVWLRPEKYSGVIVCKRDELIAVGGYDERFEFYGPEDRDMEMRLRRHSGAPAVYPYDLIEIVRTSADEKAKNYRIKADSYHDLSAMMRPIYEENEKNGVIVVNKGIEWGAWQ